MTKIKAVLFTALLALVLAGCGGASGSSKGLGAVIEAMREIYLWPRSSGVEVTEVCVVEVEI